MFPKAKKPGSFIWTGLSDTLFHIHLNAIGFGALVSDSPSLAQSQIIVKSLQMDFDCENRRLDLPGIIEN